MRSTLILLVLACATAFCQDRGSVDAAPTPMPDAAPQPFTGGVPQQLNDRLRQLLSTNGQQLHWSAAITPPIGACSIPLLSAAAPGKPVPMPGATKPNNPVNTASPIDHMKIVAPAPACRVAASAMPAPVTALPPRQ